MAEPLINDPRESLDVAVVGMAGRFPGAANLAEFWRNLRDGVESIVPFSDEELEALGVERAALADPSFVKAGAVLDQPELFDAGFFGYSPREARVLDPQHRIFLETAWEALENAGYDPAGCPGIVGVYAGMSLSTYLLFNLLTSPQFANPDESFQVMLGNDKDFLSTRVSYELNLQGPSLDVQTGCSTSLVAVHLACQGLLTYQTDMALAGGISVQVPQRTGYFYQPGGINSPDGHCRAFDARAEGTVFGSGVGIVVLKRFVDALEDGDHVRAVIKGSAVNNDGALKIGYTAPGLNGQVDAIEMAQAVSGVDPETISYVETHGTATALGDPVEVSALTKAFRARTAKTGFCALGAVKSNIGHLDAAAGVAGLIKTVLALEHRQLPPSLHFEEPNPRIDFDSSPFYVNSELADWRPQSGTLRAGVSSFGIGGTNAHLIVEEAPPRPASGPSRACQLLVISARTNSALDSATANLAEQLERQPEIELPDLAYTLQVGRKVMEYRRVCVCADRDDALRVLSEHDPQRLFTHYEEAADRPVVFMFPGGGAQYVDMASDLLDAEPVFRAEIERCAGILAARHDFDLLDALYPEAERATEAEALMQTTSVGLPALFAVEYALARQWISWGIHPESMIGHSLGEYVAACLAGVFTLESALALVVLRGKLFEQLPEGGMLSVPLAEDEVRPLMDRELSLAAINGPDQCVVSGPTRAIDRMIEVLAERDVESRRIKIEVAAHSRAVDLITGAFRATVESVELAPPRIPWVSNVTGTWITPAEAIDPHYWGRQLRHTVRFGDGIAELLEEPSRILLEVGPGQVLTTLARAQAGSASALSSIRHPYDRQSDDQFLLTTLGRLWLAGAKVDWKGFYGDERRRRLQLPTYPFERQRFWIDADPLAAGIGIGRQAREKKSDVCDWFYVPSWKRTALPPPVTADPATDPRTDSAADSAAESAGAESAGAESAEGESAEGEHRVTWLLLTEPRGPGAALGCRLRELGRDVVVVQPGKSWSEADSVYTVRPDRREDYERLLETLAGEGRNPSAVVHLWSLGPRPVAAADSGRFDAEQTRGFYSLLYLAPAIGAHNASRPVDLWVVGDQLQQVDGNDRLAPEKAPLLAACRVIPQEHSNFTCRAIDLELEDPPAADEDGPAERLLAEIEARGEEGMVAYRGRQRWVQRYEPVRLEPPAEPAGGLREGGVYLITGGLGGVGLHLARHLAETAGARLVLTGRSALPPREEWPDHLARAAEDDGIAAKIAEVQELEKLGAEVLVMSADVSSRRQMRALIERVDERFGRLDGVVHAAGLTGEQAVQFLSDVEPPECEKHFAAKARGLYVLEEVLAERELDFCLLCSSTAAVLGGLGLASYAAANLFMDSFAHARRNAGGCRWISANWDGWLLAGQESLSTTYQSSIDRYAMAPEESRDAFCRLTGSGLDGQVVVSTGDLASRVDLWLRRKGLEPQDAAAEAGLSHPRPEVDTPYEPPGNELEETIARTWQEALGIERLGIHDNFFDLGGNSLIGLRVIARLKEELGVEIKVVTLFEGPTVSALARLLGEDESAAPAYADSRSRGERRRSRRRQRRRASAEAGIADE